MEEPAEQHAVAVANFAFELGVLKRMRRAGWWHAGVRDPESVAEHSLRVAQLASLIAAIEGAEPSRAAL
ncbi:MAG: HD domain-containing protein, partial [Pseudonocardiaceae bacterium]